MVKAVLDTNILIDFLNGVTQARIELDQYSARAISIISWIEVMIGAPPQYENETRVFLSGFDVIGVTPAVAERTVSLRRDHRMKLPDALVWASAQVNDLILVTRDTKDFPAGHPGIRIPYSI